jgi:peptidoglycan hydrolase-like protein with peptidoglycan-binding domain
VGTLKSKEFAGDPKLEACAVSDPAHVVPGSFGQHVVKIQQALIRVAGLAIDPAEIAQQRYGPATVEAVRQFKTDRNILNYEGKIDVIVGKKTIRALDDGLLLPPPVPPVPPVPRGQLLRRET